MPYCSGRTRPQDKKKDTSGVVVIMGRRGSWLGLFCLVRGAASAGMPVGSFFYSTVSRSAYLPIRVQGTYTAPFRTPAIATAERTIFVTTTVCSCYCVRTSSSCTFLMDSSPGACTYYEYQTRARQRENIRTSQSTHYTTHVQTALHPLLLYICIDLTSALKMNFKRSFHLFFCGACPLCLIVTNRSL